MLIIAILDAKKAVKPVKETYTVVPPGTTDMLSWKRPIEAQPLMIGDLMRIGTVGDGNCLLHSILFAGSASYRAQGAATRSTLADAFRRVLASRDSELMELADVRYSEIGGMSALEEDFTDLHKKRDELDVLMGPLIAQLYGFNLLAIQVREGGEIRPVMLTAGGLNRSLPTILVNYLGGGLDFGNANAFGVGVRHYESVVAAAVAVSSMKGRKTLKKSAPAKIEFDTSATQFVFRPDDPTMVHLFGMFGI